VTGNFISPACNECNLQIKCPSTSRKGDKRFPLTVVIHNSKGYDSHLIIKYFKKVYTEKRGKRGSVSYDDVKIIAVSPENYATF
jgi:hypothetical protein